jgi:hypothetical protein
VTRATIDGKQPGGWVPEQKIKPEEALRAYTVSAAYAAFEEKEKGSLEIGKLADFVILSDDPLSVRPEAIEKIQVDATVVGGKVVFQNRTRTRTRSRRPAVLRRLLLAAVLCAAAAAVSAHRARLDPRLGSFRGRRLSHRRDRGSRAPATRVRRRRAESIRSSSRSST